MQNAWYTYKGHTESHEQRRTVGNSANQTIQYRLVGGAIYFHTFE